MVLRHYHPLSLLGQFSKESDDWFKPLLSLKENGEGLQQEMVWKPEVDIQEDEKAYVVTADIPGVDPKEIEITAHGNLLSIQGERNVEKNAEGTDSIRRERIYGRFRREFQLPDEADLDGISAKSEHGVIRLTIPKHKKTQPKRINVE